MASTESSVDCNRIVFEAVNENSVSKFQLVKRAYHPIEVLSSLVHWNEKGETPLLIAIKGGNISLIDVLVKFLQSFDHEVTKYQVMSDAMDKLFYPHIPIMELIEHLIKQSYYSSRLYSGWLDFFAQVAFKSTYLSRQDKIMALELIGAFLGNCYRYYEENGNPFAVMFRCWREAMTLRYSPADGEPILPKIPHTVGVPSAASSVVFGSDAEVMSMEVLNLLQQLFGHNEANPHLVVRLRCNYELQRQCLLVIRRICSQATHQHLYSFYLQNLFEYGGGRLKNLSSGDAAMNIKIAINTFLLFLEQVTELDPQLLSLKLFHMFIEALSSVSCYISTASDLPGYPGREELISYTNLLALTKFVGTIPKFFPNPAMMSVMFGDVLADLMSDLIFTMEYISPRLNNQKRKQLEEYFRNYIRNLFPERTTTVLHAGVRAFLDGKFPLSNNLKPIQLMIKLGADPNAIDENGRTPLHILAAKEKVYLDENLPILQALVDAGVHLDIAANNGDTVLDILKRNLEMYKNSGVAAESYFSSLIKTVFPLSCYCARVIRQNGIQFDEDRLPLHLQDFVSCHSDKGSSIDMIDLNLALLFGSSNIL